MKNSFFPSAVTEWNKIDKNIRKSESFNILKKNILRFIRPSQNRVYNCHKPNGIKLLTTLRVELSQLREYKFKNSFQDTLNPIRTLLIRYVIVAKILKLHLITLFTVQTFYKKGRPSWTQSVVLLPIFLIEIILHGKEDLDNINNTSILYATIDCLIETKRFNAVFLLSRCHGFNIDVAFKIHIY